MKELKAYATSQKKLKIASGEAWNPLLGEDKEPVNLLLTKPNGHPRFPDGI